LPVPLSPVISTVAVDDATLSMVRRSSTSCGDSPIRIQLAPDLVDGLGGDGHSFSGAGDIVGRR